MSDISLSAGIRNSLLQLQLLQSAADKNNQRLASGKKVSQVLDDPVNFYRSKGSYDLADSMQGYKDGIDQGISTLKAMENGLDKYKDILQQVQGLAEQAKNASAADKLTLQLNAGALLGAARDLLYDTSVSGTNLIYQTTRGVQLNGTDTDDGLDYPGQRRLYPGQYQSYTQAVWVNTTSNTGAMVLDNAGYDNVEIANTGVVRMRSTGTSTIFVGTTKVNDGNWHRIVTVHDAQNGQDRIYVDGKLDATSTDNNALGVTLLNPGSGGGSHSIGGTGSNGISYAATALAVDDVQFWAGLPSATAAGIGTKDGAWDGTDAAYDYAAEQPPPGQSPSSMLTRFNFIEGTGTTTANTGVLATSTGTAYLSTPATIPSLTGANLTDGPSNLTNFWNGKANNNQPFATVLTIQLSKVNSYTIQGRNMAPSALGVTLDFSAAGINNSIASIKSAIAQVDAQASSFSNDFALLQTRLNYTGIYVNTLQEAGDKLTLADLNEEAANSLAIKTRQELSIQSLSLASESEASILSLFNAST